MNEQELEKKAIEEILLEAEKGKERAKEMGAFGWNKPKIASVNKRFLSRMLVSTIRSGQNTKTPSDLEAGSNQERKKDDISEKIQKDVEPKRNLDRKRSYNESDSPPAKYSKRKQMLDTHEHRNLVASSNLSSKYSKDTLTLQDKKSENHEHRTENQSKQTNSKKESQKSFSRKHSR